MPAQKDKKKKGNDKKKKKKKNNKEEDIAVFENPMVDDDGADQV